MLNLLKKILIILLFGSPVVACSAISKTVVKNVDDGKLTQEESNFLANPEKRRVFVNESPEDNEILRKVSLKALMNSAGYDVLEKLMMEILSVEKGVGIAAPQVGINRRVIIVQRLDKEGTPFEYYYNPLITEKRGDLIESWEGCLSVPAGFGKVKRRQDVDVEYDWEENGKIIRKRERISGFTAVIFQHEIDHLDGVLFIDKKSDEPLVPKDEYYEMKKREKESR